MSTTTQIAFTIDDDELARLDQLVPSAFPSRASALRAAVHEWLARQREQAIDEALERGYAAVPEDESLTAGLAAVAAVALGTSDLDW